VPSWNMGIILADSHMDPGRNLFCARFAVTHKVASRMAPGTGTMTESAEGTLSIPMQRRRLLPVGSTSSGTFFHG
jgi:hypothetical protein